MQMSPKTDILPETAQYGYIPGLDGLRAIAVLIVIIAHFGLDYIVPGGFGVTVFFFISGFLITRLLLAEQDKNGQIALGAFYIRRLVRLYPALLFMVFASSALFYVAGMGGPSRLEMLAAIGYGTNVYQVFAVAPGLDAPGMPWTPLWSLAVEEHFYLLFPLLVVMCGTHIRCLRASLIALVILVPLWRWYVATHFDVSVMDYNYMMTDARIDSIVWGCLMSVLLHDIHTRGWLKVMVGYLPTLIAITALLVSLLYRDEGFRYIWRYSLQGIAILVLFMNFFYHKPFQWGVAMMEWSPLAWIGKVSYALYLWHFPVFDFVAHQMDGSWLVVPIAILVSLAITAFSFYAVERPFNRLRRKFGSYTPVKPKIV